MFDSDEIIGDKEKTENVGMSENLKDGGDTGNTEEVGNIADARDKGDVEENKMGRGNAEEEQEDIEVGNNEEDDGRD